MCLCFFYATSVSWLTFFQLTVAFSLIFCQTISWQAVTNVVSKTIITALRTFSYSRCTFIDIWNWIAKINNYRGPVKIFQLVASFHFSLLRFLDFLQTYRRMIVYPLTNYILRSIRMSSCQDCLYIVENNWMFRMNIHQYLK